MTDKQFALHRAKQQAGYIELVNDLHEAGFANALLESQAISKEDYWMRVIIPDVSVEGDRFGRVLKVCEDHGATLSLSEVRLQGVHDMPRLTIWIRRG